MVLCPRSLCRGLGLSGKVWSARAALPSLDVVFALGVSHLDGLSAILLAVFVELRMPFSLLFSPHVCVPFLEAFSRALFAARVRPRDRLQPPTRSAASGCTTALCGLSTARFEPPRSGPRLRRWRRWPVPHLAPHPPGLRYLTTPC